MTETINAALADVADHPDRSPGGNRMPAMPADLHDPEVMRGSWPRPQTSSW